MGLWEPFHLKRSLAIVEALKKVCTITMSVDDDDFLNNFFSSKTFLNFF
jgi:hypothetical protein